MNTNIRPRAAHALTALLLTLSITGCSKPPPANSEPLVTAPDATDKASTIRGSITLNGMQVRYTAHLKKGRIASIDEVRSAQDGRSPQGTYSFYEARLVKYSGQAFAASEREEVEFDLHGAIKQSRADGGTPSAGEIDAIRNRAELLRSHALTQQAVQAHQY
jgi:hypothetical protein